MNRYAIYRLQPDEAASRFQLINPDEFVLRYPHAFRQHPMSGFAHPLPNRCTVTNPSGSLTNFGVLMSGAIVWSRVLPEHAPVEDDILRADCEEIPLTVDGSAIRHVAINPPVVNAIDRRRASLRRDADGRIIGIDRYMFLPHRLNRRIFRVPEGAPWDIFTLLHTQDSLEERAIGDLYAAHATRGLTGLTFERVWESD